MAVIQERGPINKVLPASKRFYRPELDVLRFTAFILVFFHHIPEFPYGSPNLVNTLYCCRVGLCLFFLLSAYLITELLLRERTTTKTVHIKAFFVRRALRIWPLYFLAVGASYFLGQFSNTWHTPLIALPFLLFLGTNIFIAHYGWQFALIGPLWSLSIEEQFYLVIPSIAKVGGAKALKWVACLCLAISYCVLIWLGHQGAPLVLVIWVNSFVQFQFFAAGTLIAILLHKREWGLAWWARGTLLLLGSLVVCLSEWFFHLTVYRPASLPGVVVGYAMVLVGCSAFFLAFVKADLNAPAWLIYLGRISYGLYVFHGFVIGFELAILHWAEKHGKHFPVLVTHLLALPVTILLAAFSYRFFEQPILKWKQRFTYVRSGASAELSA